MKVLKYLPEFPTKIFYKKVQDDKDFVQANLIYRIGTRSHKGFFKLPDVRPCPVVKKCLLAEVKVYLYQLFKLIPDADKQFIKSMF